MTALVVLGEDEVRNAINEANKNGGKIIVEPMHPPGVMSEDVTIKVVR